MGQDGVSVERLRERFPQAVLDASEFRGEISVVVRATDLLPICQFLRDDADLAFDLCLFVSAVDQLDLGLSPRFVAVYQLYSLKHHRRLRLKVPLSGEAPTVDSVSTVWAAADWHEREAFDLMGIKFRGHPKLKRILMPDDWSGYPLRKEYPQRGH